jgi:large subunit ribosomal protein L15
MNLHELKSKNQSRDKKRVGRGGKRGTYSGRGQKGQHSRAGRKVRPAMRDVLIRTPKRRGYANKRKSPSLLTISLNRLEKIKTEKIDLAFLIENKIVRKSVKLIKIVAGKKELTSVLHLEGIKTTQTAKNQIEKAGGSVA